MHVYDLDYPDYNIASFSNYLEFVSYSNSPRSRIPISSLFVAFRKCASFTVAALSSLVNHLAQPIVSTAHNRSLTLDVYVCCKHTRHVK